MMKFRFYKMRVPKKKKRMKANSILSNANYYENTEKVIN